MKRLARPLLAAPLLLLGSCAMTFGGPKYSACRAMETRNWSASVEVEKEGKFPFPEERVLVVSGTVQVPTGGYSLALDAGPLVRLEPPVQQVILRTTAPEGMATQAITEEQVSGRLPYDKRARSVEIRCGDATIARIPVIENRTGA